MSTLIVKLPNYLLGRFSTIVDHFTHINKTEEEMKDILINEYDSGKIQANEKIKRGLLDVNRWEDCSKIIETIHGKEELRALKKFVTICRCR